MTRNILCYDVDMKMMKIFRIPSMRERYSRYRFNVLRKIRLRQSENKENIELLDYSKEALTSYVSISDRVNFLVNAVENSVRIKDEKLLVIGPRFESEIYGYMSLGFKPRNIEAIDTYSYSRKIHLGNMHNMNFPDGYFDVIVCGWTLVYSNNIKRALAEIYRVAKSGCKIFISFDSFSKKKNNSLEDIYIDNSNTAFIEYANNFNLFSYTNGKTSWSGNQTIACFVLEK